MMQGKTYNIFISHAWDYKDEYHRLCDLLNSAPYFSWKDYSVPSHDPLTGALRKQFDDRIQLSSVVLVLSGMYAKYSNWMQAEMRIAKSYNKPIIGIIPQGQDRVPVDVQQIADELVRWNTDSIISAIRQHA
ncbi:MAG: TIR domain-containing protein [Nitrososphaerota archaeon]|nr:TIR domain-containing protein [Nitrososphaerota archaeon]